ncbi:hypothetical protein PG993_008680 [Apiospora rasikravindrae]|uniref:Uncharacterized protein n=1 Tax=Apiospora rasikravindrae TaxID=990691 RepID=A0ABR1SR78_9PEZI
MDSALFNAEELPFGTTAVPTTLLVFDFLQALRQFKDTLPTEYLKDSWFPELKKQCVILIDRHKSSNMSLLFLQVDFLTCVYRGVHGGIAPESGWEKMKANLSTEKNGTGDFVVKNRELFERAMYKITAEELISHIAKGGRLLRQKLTFMTPLTVAPNTERAPAVKDEDAADTSSPLIVQVKKRKITSHAYFPPASRVMENR